MSRRAKLAITALFFVLFGWLYIHTGRLPGDARRLEFALATAAAASLTESGQDEWARVAMNGRTAVLSGIAPDETARAAAIDAVARAAPGGGVARVVDQTDLRMVVSPYIFTAHLEGDTLILSGYAPDRATRDAITARAQRMFAGTVDATAVEVASGVPEGADWLTAVDFAVAQLVRLRRGDLTIEDAEIVIQGEATASIVGAEVARQLRQAPAPFEGRAEIVALAVASPPPSAPLAAEGAAPSPSPAAATEGSPAPAPTTSLALEDCQARIDGLLANDAVRFRFNDSEVSAASRPLLDAIADIARECGRFGLRITGHTDATGDAAFNVYLSERRAQAVRDYLVNRGLDPASLTAEGLGSSAPAASNASAAGRALNRRIEIEVVERMEPAP